MNFDPNRNINLLDRAEYLLRAAEALLSLQAEVEAPINLLEEIVSCNGTRISGQELLEDIGFFWRL